MDRRLSILDASSSGQVTPAELLRWRDSLASSLARLETLQAAAQAAVDAYLLRPSQLAKGTHPSGRMSGQGRKEMARRVAEAMAQLEREISAAESAGTADDPDRGPQEKRGQAG